MKKKYEPTYSFDHFADDSFDLLCLRIAHDLFVHIVSFVIPLPVSVYEPLVVSLEVFVSFI